MKTLKKILPGIAIIFISQFTAKAQTILTDSKGEPLFKIPSSLVSAKITAKNVGLEFPIKTFKSKQFYIYEGNDTVRKVRHNTMSMSKSFYTSFNIIDNSKSNLIFTKNTNLTPSIEIGYNRTLDQLQEPNQKAGFYYTFNVAAFGKYQHFNVYDKTSMIIPKNESKRFSPGLRLGLNAFRGDRYAVAFTSSYQRSINVDELTSYQLITSSYYSDVKIATNGKNDGYVGPASAKNLYRFSLSVPYYAIPAFNFSTTSNFKDLNKIQLAFIPYYYFTTSQFTKAAHNAGVGLSLFPGRVYRNQNAKFSDALTLSYNLINSSDKTNQRFFFISGTISFGSFKKPTDSSGPQTVR